MPVISFQFHPMIIKVVYLFFYVQENFVALLPYKIELCWPTFFYSFVIKTWNSVPFLFIKFRQIAALVC